MTDIGWWVAVVVLMALNWWQALEHRKDKSESRRTIKDLNDRLMAKIPEHYFAVRMEEEQQKVEAATPKPEEVDPLMYNVGPRP